MTLNITVNLSELGLPLSCLYLAAAIAFGCYIIAYAITLKNE